MSRQQRRSAQRKYAKSGARLAAGVSLALGAALVPEAAHAATFTVTNTNDSGSGSLRDAIAQANATPGPDTIDFTVSGTITLTTGELAITDSVTIDGPGAASLTISGNNASRVFNSNGTGVLDVVLEGLTLTGGLTANRGGAIDSRENLTITNAVITGNTAEAGGGVYQKDGALILTNVAFTNNEATEAKGALEVVSVPSATLTNVQIVDNDAAQFEGGLGFNGVGTLVIEDSTIRGNETPGGVGGMIIFNGDLVAPAVIRRTTISGNSAAAWAGGLRVSGTTLTIENSTISGNSAGSDPGAFYRNGGGLYLKNTDVTLRHSTIAGNTAASGGNIVLYDSTATLTIENSIVADGTAVSAEDILIVDGGTVAANYSLVETPPAGMTGANNITGVDPQLGALQDNGGATETHLPAATSLVINAGDPLFAAPPTTDQHGLPRVADGRTDIGSVEVQSIVSLSAATYSVNENGGTLTVTVNRTGGTAGAIQVDYATGDGTADGLDYDASAGTLQWADGDAAAKTFNVTITNDNVFEGNQTFNITLTAPGGGAIIGKSAAVATILENDSQPAISIGNVTQNEGSSGTTNFTFAVTLSNPSTQTVTVNYATSNGTTDASDFTATSAALTFNPEVTSQNVIVQVAGDTTSEPDETFAVTLSSPANATIASGIGTGTIQNDDSPFTVTNTNDSGPGSLRSAVASANALAGADTINFAVTGTITLTSGQLAITGPVTIDGPGSASLTIDGNDNSRIFNVDDANAALQNVAIEGLTLTGGNAHEGGAIRSRENLTLTDCIVHDNAANLGGGIEHATGSIALTNVVVSENSAVSFGGISVHEATAANATFSNVRVIDNTASFFIGGLGVQMLGTVLIEDSTISGNTSPRGGGLSLSYADQTSPAMIRGTTVSGNIATTSDTGGVFATGTSLTLENTTISGNSAAEHGGGLYFYGATITLRNSTLTGNSAGIAGGNVLHNGGATLVVENSIVANGVAPAGPDIHFLHAGNSVTANYSLIETPPVALTGANNITGVDPQLGTLQNNGGSTLTHMPASTSPVINAGNPSFAGPPSTDQRGSTRVANTIIDMGSVEVQNILSLSSATYSVGENGGTLTIAVNRTGSSGALSVNYATSNGTATGADYDAAAGTLNWASGDTGAKTFNVTITNDTIFEGDQNFNITLSSATGDVTLGTSSAVATITDDESQPTISIGNVTQNEGNSGTTNFTFAVTLSNTSAQTITINYATANGTASAGSDYTATSGPLTFNPEVTSQNVVVAVTGETTIENNETFTVTLSTPANATIATGTGTGTIMADDASAFGAPQLLSATAASASQVNLTWAPVAGATTYDIFRATSIGSGYSLLTTTSNNFHSDNTVSANTTYLYKVCANGGPGTPPCSSVDAATTVVFTDPTLSSAIKVKAAHIMQLRTAVNAMRAAAGLPAATFTDATLTAGSTKPKAVHIAELRMALDAARAAIGLAALSYTDPTITAQSTKIKAAHIAELRSGIQ
ncbi:MAG TPA: Calx-beta domain-containing protein [Thermoanaerobaculia bacterium]|nr:Calx-beta domain-containing protein [Thermoanaerobaculia bacterium]